ncbi:hypothetical protein GCM10009117_01970 [Gangjinia marincola]|uniref:Peptidase C45 hydrolase domain-containing protein n=1 Tax=Gangjinia marincola TaxID=578463 RepID=A0ABP3XTY0_9FLAO
MKTSFFLKLTLLVLSILHVCSALACTTVSYIDKYGNVWNANNEDGPYATATFINVYPKSHHGAYGYYTLSYLSPMFGQTSQLQGGMNEAGLTFDFNAIPAVENVDLSHKKSFEGGDEAILTHLLSTMRSVDQVIAFFEEYWFSNGFTNAQMHVTDRSGKMVIISASGVLISQKPYLISTNFDLAAGKSDQDCWRYKAATSIVQKEHQGLNTMLSLCKATEQKNGRTMYSNIQNLTTGELWFSSKDSQGATIHTSLQKLLEKGQKFYSFQDLAAINEDFYMPDDQLGDTKNLEAVDKSDLVGTYFNEATGNVTIHETEKGIRLSFENDMSVECEVNHDQAYVALDAPIRLHFHRDTDGQLQLSLFEEHFWSFTAMKQSNAN